MSARELAERLEEYPELKERVEELLALVENGKGDAGKADEAEERVTEEIRKVGLVLMQSWAKRKNERVSREADQRSDMARKEKKPLLVHAIWTSRGRGADLLGWNEASKTL
jgi:hypothetical protein